MKRVPRYVTVAPYVLTLVMTAVAILYSVHYTNAQQAQLAAQQRSACGFAAVIGSVPVPSKPPPSKLAIELVADSRSWWRSLHCPGSLPPPPGFAQWAVHYGISPK